MTARSAPQKPTFRVTLKEKPSRHIFERTPRYAVLVNGRPKGQLHYNMHGYQGCLPTVHGWDADIGERGITAFRKEVARINREAEEAIERGASDARRIVLTRPTEDPHTVFALSRDLLTEIDRPHMLSRREFLQARRLFGSEDVGVGFFRESELDPDTAPVTLFEEEDRALAAGLPQLRARIMDRAEAETHARSIERVIGTEDPDVLLVVSRRVLDDADPELHHVDRMRHHLARTLFGADLRLSDLEPAEARPAIRDPADRAFLRRSFPWFDPDGAPDAERPEGP